MASRAPASRAPRERAWHRLLLVSDLHAMSRYGLVPPRYWPRGHESALPSMRYVRYLWRCWEDLCRRAPKVDALIVNGDLIEGENPSRREAMDALTDDVLVQAAACEEILGRLVDRTHPDELWIVRGTPYHEGRHFEAIEAVARNLGARPWSRQRYTGYVLDAEWRGLALNVTHHMTTGAIYSGTLSTRTALFAAAAEQLGKVPHADVIVRAHLHLRHFGKYYERYIILQPAFKVVTPYAIKKMELYRASLIGSDLGAIMLETDGSGRLFIDDDTYAYPALRATPLRVGAQAPARSGRPHRRAGRPAGRTAR